MKSSKIFTAVIDMKTPRFIVQVQLRPGGPYENIGEVMTRITGQPHPEVHYTDRSALLAALERVDVMFPEGDARGHNVDALVVS